MRATSLITWKPLGVSTTSLTSPGSRPQAVSLKEGKTCSEGFSTMKPPPWAVADCECRRATSAKSAPPRISRRIPSRRAAICWRSAAGISSASARRKTCCRRSLSGSWYRSGCSSYSRRTAASSISRWLQPRVSAMAAASSCSSLAAREAARAGSSSETSAARISCSAASRSASSRWSASGAAPGSSAAGRLWRAASSSASVTVPPR